MIFAKVDVKFRDHHRALAVGAVGRDLYVWGLLYSAEHLTDGALPMAAVVSSPWGRGGQENVVVAATLVDQGLWTRTDLGWQTCRYEEKNRTRADVERFRKDARKRADKFRKRVKRSNGVVTRESRVSNALPGGGVSRVTSGSGSVSVSDSVLEKETGEDSPAREGDGAEVAELKPSTLRYRTAYCHGIAEAKGTPYAWPPGPKSDEWADKDLGHAIATFAKSRSTGKSLRGESLAGWISAAAEDFARHVLKAGDDPKYWCHFAPKGLVKFLNQDSRTEEARHVG